MVYVLDIDGNPLMPTKRHGWVRRSLREGKAKVVRTAPFTIQLLYEPDTKVTQTCSLGIDMGYEYIGASVVTKKEEVFNSTFKVRTDIQSKLETKRMYRRNRRGRKTRYRKPRFLNRKKPYRDAPSIRHKVDSHLRIMKWINAILPLKRVVVEIANFDPHKLKNPNVNGVGYQYGEAHGFENVKSYVLHRDGHQCYFSRSTAQKNRWRCLEKLQVHHIEFRSNRGSNAPNNLITLCEKCHKQLHKQKCDLPKDIKRKHKKLRSATFMNHVSKRLVDFFGDKIHYTYGYTTKFKRYKLGIEKSHANDAFVIAGGRKQRRCQKSKAIFKRRNNRELGKQRKGFAPSSRKQRYPIQPMDVVEYEGVKYHTKGTHNKGMRIIITVNGKNKSVAVKKVKHILSQKSLLFV